MATNHQTWQLIRNAHKDIVTLDGYISIGADAAVIAAATAAVSGKGGLKEPVAGTSWVDFSVGPSANVISKPAGTGVYQVLLGGKYLRLLAVDAVFCTNGAVTADRCVDIGPNNIFASTAAGSQKLVFHVRKKSDGSMVDPTAACGIRFSARLKNG